MPGREKKGRDPGKTVYPCLPKGHARFCADVADYTYLAQQLLKRVVFIGITLSEVAACGLAAAMVWQIHPFIGAGALTALAVAVLSYPFETRRLPRDAVLGVMFVGASAVSVSGILKLTFSWRFENAIVC